MPVSPLRIKTRIKTSKNISQITHAMEMVSASKMRRAQDRAQSGAPYSQELAQTIHRLTKNIDPERHPLLMKNTETSSSLYLIISTDKGLTGGLNTNLFNTLEKHLRSLPKSENPVFVTMGRKARDYIAKTNRELVATFDTHDQPTISEIAPVAQILMQGYLDKKYSSVNLVYSEFITTLSQKPQIINLLPLGTSEQMQGFSGIEGDSTAPQQTNDTQKQPQYTFEPDADTVLGWLLPFYVENRIYQLILESLASEHSARMVAMKNAHDNAQDIVSDLTLVYNQARQAKVTNELLDAFAARLTLN